MEGEENWKTVRTEDAREMFLLEDLSPNKEYQFQYTACCKVGLSKTSELSPPIKTLPTSPPEKLRMVIVASSVISVAWMSPTIIASEIVVKEYKNLEVPNKVILVMGATGCGKTTLINGMINYILGVQWEDNFRFKVIHETTQRSKAGSRTSEVTAYVVNHQKGFRIPYSLTIIDTPGFGGTRDSEQDKLIEEQLLEFFSTPGGIEHIDAICLVAQAFLAHSTHAQKHIFDSMLSMLGKDLKDNIQLLITFADGGTPPVLEALKEAELPCAQDESGTPLHFRFNHSALFAPRENGGSHNAIAKIFWKTSTESMKDFFDSIKMLEPKKLTLTTEVLKEHRSLDGTLEGLQNKLRATLIEVKELKVIQVALEQCTIDVLASRDFEYEVEKCLEETINSPSVYCPSCSTVCRYNCHLQNLQIAQLFHPYAFTDVFGKCMVCPGHCILSNHVERTFYTKTNIVKEKKFHTALKKRYEEAKAKENALKEKLKSLDGKFNEIRLGIKTSLDHSCRCLKNLQEITLKPIMLSIPENQDLRILSEKQELKAIQFVMDMRTLVERLQKLPSGI
ncbi:Receptor-type tyrosine-protein phosphatase S, partial [Ophiophagus hannah]